MSYVLGIDLGTSSLKGLLVTKEGELVASASAEYDLMHLQPGFSEQNPKDWLLACDKVFEALTDKVADFTSQLEGISFSGQMHSLVLLDGRGHVLRPAILWNDTRTSAQCRQIEENLVIAYWRLLEIGRLKVSPYQKFFGYRKRNPKFGLRCVS